MKILSFSVIAALALPFSAFGMAVGPNEALHRDLQKRTCADPSLSTILYMDYNPDTNDRFYTDDFDTFFLFFRHFGYFETDFTCMVFATQQPGTVGLWEVLKATAAPRFYTASVDEKDDALANQGYAFADIVAWIYDTPSPACATIPLFHLLNNATGDHYYTASETNKDSFVSDKGYIFVGITGYVLQYTP
ncbi:hypothetical protein BD779DRAFT_1677333 [Infundibulicybe gibba]|nr:hypothetical protein BD779DRAFT_1677333 [Infundibulicybe gibba]